jgi:transposase
MRAVVDFGVGGMASVAITRTELDSVGLRAAAAGSSDAKQARRLLALAMVLDGHPRLLAAQAGGMDRQTLRDWVHRYNAHGVEGLRDVRNKGRAPALSAEQMQELENLVLAGPDLKQDGVVRWRCVDLRSQIKTRFAVALHERTVGKLLRRLGMTRLQPRPFHPKADAAAQQAYKKTSPAWSPTPCRPRWPARP